MAIDDARVVRSSYRLSGLRLRRRGSLALGYEVVIANGVLAYSPEEAAGKIGVSRSKVYQLIERGELPIVKVGRRTLIRHVSLVTFLAEREHLVGRRSSG